MTTKMNIVNAVFETEMPNGELFVTACRKAAESAAKAAVEMVAINMCTTDGYISDKDLSIVDKHVDAAYNVACNMLETARINAETYNTGAGFYKNEEDALKDYMYKLIRVYVDDKQIYD